MQRYLADGSLVKRVEKDVSDPSMVWVRLVEKGASKAKWWKMSSAAFDARKPYWVDKENRVWHGKEVLEDSESGSGKSDSGAGRPGVSTLNRSGG